MSWSDDSIVGAERMTDQELVAAIDAGARVVVLDMVATVAFMFFRGRRPHLVRAGQSVGAVAALPTLITGLLGWWGVAVFWTPVALYRNLTGGVDVTGAVRRARWSRLTATSAAAERLAEAVARAGQEPGGAGDRRLRALELLAARRLDEAWAAVDGVLDDPAIRYDLQLLRRLAIALHDKGRWAPAARVAELLVQEFPAEASQGYLGQLVRESRSRAGIDVGPSDGARAIKELATLMAVAVVALLGFALANAYYHGLLRFR